MLQSSSLERVQGSQGKVSHWTSTKAGRRLSKQETATSNQQRCPSGKHRRDKEAMVRHGGCLHRGRRFASEWEKVAVAAVVAAVVAVDGEGWLLVACVGLG
ncbi:hypothetical protein Droror1_Dr00011803 [Drosera rotundifolia]